MEKVYNSENLNILHPTVLTHFTSNMYCITASNIRKNEEVFESLMKLFLNTKGNMRRLAHYPFIYSTQQP